MLALILINGLGLLAGAALAGVLVSHGATPTYSIIAGLVFLGGMAYPLTHEYGALGRGVREAEAGLSRTLLRRPTDVHAEIFTRSEASPVYWRHHRLPLGLMIAVTLTGFGLLAYDGASNWDALSARVTGSDEIISNF